METTTHRRVGLATAMVAAHLHPLPVIGIALSAGAAWLFSGGATSPDVDNQPAAKTLDRWLPDEWLGHGGPLGHRRLAHWWGLPALAAAAWQRHPPADPGLLTWVVWGALLGWCSHLAGDFAFGQGNGRVGLARGVPAGPWFWHIGLGWKADGWMQRLTGWLADGVSVWALLTLFPALARYWP